MHHSVLLESENIYDTDLRVEMIGTGGQLIRQFILSAGERRVELNLSEVPKGVYVLRIVNGTDIYTDKVIKQ